MKKKGLMMIDNVEGMVKSIVLNSQMQSIINDGVTETSHQIMAHQYEDELFCPVCGASRRQKVERFSSNHGVDIIDPGHKIEFKQFPIVHIATCLQCRTKSTMVLYKGPERLELAILRNAYGGSVTENTPEEVKYYLDQAYRSRMLSALSAAMAMYRSALEWILFEQGYRNGMLGAKISKLEEDIGNNIAPKWANDMPIELLSAIKNIGNSAMHTNGGDISKQKQIDGSLIELVDVVFAELLDVIYEQPIRRNKNVQKLKNVAGNLSK